MTYLFSVELIKTIMITSPLCSLEGLQLCPESSTSREALNATPLSYFIYITPQCFLYIAIEESAIQTIIEQENL